MYYIDFVTVDKGEIMIFPITADARFEAENIDDAFLKLSKHFQILSEGGLEKTDIFIGGSISVDPFACKEE